MDLGVEPVGSVGPQPSNNSPTPTPANAISSSVRDWSAHLLEDDSELTALFVDDDVPSPSLRALRIVWIGPLRIIGSPRRVRASGWSYPSRDLRGRLIGRIVVGLCPSVLHKAGWSARREPSGVVSAKRIREPPFAQLLVHQSLLRPDESQRVSPLIDLMASDPQTMESRGPGAVVRRSNRPTYRVVGSRVGRSGRPQ